MGFLGGLWSSLNETAQRMDEKSKEHYAKYKNLCPEKILLEMDKGGNDIAKKMALQKLYAEKAGKMSVYELEKVTKGAKSHCTVNTYNYAVQIYQKETDRRDPWT